MKLTSRVVKTEELTPNNINTMYSLMEDVYFGTNFDRFKSDLFAKDFVLLLDDNENKIAGFTTLQIFDFEGKIIIYSGDTVIREDVRGEIELMRAWWRFSYKIQQQNPTKEVLWLLISKGWRTYKFFPMFLEKYYPSHKYQTPDEIQNFIDRLSVKKFGNCYKNGLIIPENPDMLKSGQDDIPEKRMDDEDVKFFLSKNPEFYKGNELVCLAKLHPDNLTKAGKRLLHGVRSDV